MSVLIHNVSEEKGVKYGYGKQHYLLCINRTVKAEFTHNFEEGLATCLRKAADALDKCEVDVPLSMWYMANQ
jgi:hypothetical protein